MADPIGVVPGRSDAEIVATHLDLTPAPVSNPPDPQVPAPAAPDYNAGLAGTDTSPKPISNPPDPQVSAGEVAAVPTSDVQTKPDPMAIEDESSWGVVTPAQQASADEINRSANPQDPSYYGLGSNSDTFTGDVFKLNDTGAAAAQAVVGAGQAQAQQSNSDMAAQLPGQYRLACHATIGPWRHLFVQCRGCWIIGSIENYQWGSVSIHSCNQHRL